MTRTGWLVVSVLALSWAVPAHAGHIMGVNSFTVTPGTAKVGDKITVTVKGYINFKNYKCVLSASGTEGAIATPAEIASPNDASISLATPFNFSVSFDTTFQNPHSPAEIAYKLGQSTLEGQPSGNCDAGMGQASQVWITAPGGKGKLTGVTFPLPKVKTGELVDFTVAGTGGLCVLNFQFAGGSWNGNTSPLESALPFTAAKAAFTKDGAAEITVSSPPSMTCEGGEVKAMITVEKVEPKKADLVCTVTAFKDAARTQAIDGGSSVALPAASPKVWVVVTLQNVGDAAVPSNFESQVTYKLNDQVAAPKFTITAPVSVGQTPRTVSVREMPVPAGSTTVDVTGAMDSKQQVDEKSEANNACKLTFTTTVPARQQAQPQIKERTVPVVPAQPRR